MRAVQELEKSDWTDVDEFIEQESFVVARDPDGRVCGIVVVSEGSDLAGDLDGWVAVDERPECVAEVEPLETRDREPLRSAIARRGRPLHRDARFAGPELLPASISATSKGRSKQGGAFWPARANALRAGTTAMHEFIPACALVW